MLILRRKIGESILIGENIRITVLESGVSGVRIAVDAPKQVSILREELSEAEKMNQGAIVSDADSVMFLQSLLHASPDTDEE